MGQARNLVLFLIPPVHAAGMDPHYRAMTSVPSGVSGWFKHGAWSSFLIPPANAGGTDIIVAQLRKEVRSGDVIAVMSNGGFGGIHEKLLGMLSEPPASAGG